MTTPLTSQPVPDTTMALSPAIAGGVFTRLNPADGLFLRAEHLDTIGQYASDLAAAVGAGVGLGVVFGFTCRLSETNDAVYATGGLAIAAGQPLRSTAMTMVSLNDLHPQADDFWVVEIVSATWEYGSEPVYGGLCEDPCSRGSGIQPYAAEGVELKLRRDSLKGFGGVEPSLQRNWLASNYFERERKYGGASARSANAPWLLPASPVENITRHAWSEGSGHHDQAAVPLGVVWKRDGKWHLDVWTARRDCGEPTPAAAWEWRLGWRPRSVFIAQVLQFQSQLAHDDLSPLYALGFEELPPAGYLPWGFENVDDGALQTAAQTLFGPEVDVRVRRCRADFVAHAVEQVQHMDRIPLKGHVAGNPKVDLLVPSEPSDLKSTWTDTYGWSAFVRRREDVPLQMAGPPSDYTPLLAALLGLLIGASTKPAPPPYDPYGDMDTPATTPSDTRATRSDTRATRSGTRATRNFSCGARVLRKRQPPSPSPEAQPEAAPPSPAPEAQPEAAPPSPAPEAQSAESAKKAPAKAPTDKSAAAPVAKASGRSGSQGRTAGEEGFAVESADGQSVAAPVAKRSGRPGAKRAEPAKKAASKAPPGKSVAAPVAKRSGRPGAKRPVPAKKAASKAPTGKSVAAPVAKRSGRPGATPAAPAKKAPTKGRTRK